MRASLATFALACSLLGAAPAARAEGIDWTGRPAPEIYVQQGLQGVGTDTTLASYAGRVLVLKFFFASCPYCRASMPDFEATSRRYAGRDDVRFLALAYDSYENVAPLVREGGYTFPVALDPSGVTPKRYGVHTYPTNYLIGADGVVKAYDDISTWAIDRVLAATPPRAPVLTPRERNLKELGEVPAELAAVKDAAGANDYGLVLRIVEPRLDASKYPSALVAAARRIQAVALEHYAARQRRIAAGMAIDRAAAWRAVDAFVADFQGTSRAAALAEWVATLPARPAPSR